MKSYLKGLAYVVSTIGLTILVVLPANKYDWVREVDPTMPIVPIDNTVDEKTMFSFFVMIVVVMAQIVISAKAVNRTEKMISIGLAVMAISVLWLRFVI